MTEGDTWLAEEGGEEEEDEGVNRESAAEEDEEREGCWFPSDGPPSSWFFLC